MDTRSSHVTRSEPIGFWSLDAKTYVSTLDGAMSAYFGISAEEGARGIAQEAGFWQRIHPEDRKGLAQAFQWAIRTQGYVLFTYRIRMPAGSLRHVRTFGRCFTDSTGRPTHVAGVLMDAEASEVPPGYVRIVRSLMQASETAAEVEDHVLNRLIDAVLLEAGRGLAHSLSIDSVCS